MKVLKEGKLPDDHGRYRGRCPLCGCEVEAGKGELLSGYPGIDAEHGLYVNCPTDGCKRQIDMQAVVIRDGR